MKRNKLLQQLKDYNPNDSWEGACKKNMVKFIEENPDCFERSLESGHITGSAFLLNNDGTKALLMLHTKLNLWLQLGGHCDGDPDVLRVAIREAQEESGIMHIEPVMTSIFDIDIHFIPARKTEKEHYHYDVRFLLQVTSDEQIVQNRESQSLQWFDINGQALPTDNRSITRMFEKAQLRQCNLSENNTLAITEQ